MSDPRRLSNNFGVVSGAYLGLSEELDNDLREWQRFFDKHFRYERGWTSLDDETHHRQWGTELFARLCSELLEPDC